jgi:DNA-binding response OmpR family regulator
VVLIGLRPEAAGLLRSWLEAADIEVEASNATAEEVAARCQLALVDCHRAGAVARLARDAWKQVSGLAVLAVVPNAQAGLAALQGGADDFLEWPGDPAQAIARVRRLEAVQARSPKRRFQVVEGFRFDDARQTVTVGAQQARLTTKCYALTLLFLRNIGRRLSRAEILMAIWGSRPDLNSRTLDAHVSQVRRVLELASNSGLALRSIYGHGYELVREARASVSPPAGRRPVDSFAERPISRPA